MTGRRNRLDASKFEDHLGLRALLAHGRISDRRGVPSDRLVRQLELELRQKDRKDDLWIFSLAEFVGDQPDDSLISS